MKTEKDNKNETPLDPIEKFLFLTGTGGDYEYKGVNHLSEWLYDNDYKIVKSNEFYAKEDVIALLNKLHNDCSDEIGREILDMNKWIKNIL